MSRLVTAPVGNAALDHYLPYTTSKKEKLAAMYAEYDALKARNNELVKVHQELLTLPANSGINTVVTRMKKLRTKYSKDFAANLQELPIRQSLLYANPQKSFFTKKDLEEQNSELKGVIRQLREELEGLEAPNQDDVLQYQAVEVLHLRAQFAALKKERMEIQANLRMGKKREAAARVIQRAFRRYRIKRMNMAALVIQNAWRNHERLMAHLVSYPPKIIETFSFADIATLQTEDSVFN